MPSAGSIPPTSLGLILFKCISFKIIKICTFNVNIANIKIAIQVLEPCKKRDPDLPIAVSFGKSFPQENVHGLELTPLKFFTKAQNAHPIDLLFTIPEIFARAYGLIG